MRDDEILAALEAEIVSVLTTPEIEGVGIPGVLPATSAESLVFCEVMGQLPAIGVIDVDVSVKQLFGIGIKRKHVTVTWELALAARDESGTPEAAATVRRLLGECNKRLDHHKSVVDGVSSRFVFDGFARPDHPRPDLALGTARYHIDVMFGNE